MRRSFDAASGQSSHFEVEHENPNVDVENVFFDPSEKNCPGAPCLAIQ